MSDNTTVGFIGLSHLGIVSSIGVASKGFSVICFDERTSLTSELAAGKLPLFEPGLEELLKISSKNIQFTAEATKLSSCDLIYIARDVPTSKDNSSDLSPIISALKLAVAQAKSGAEIVVLSQVNPGFTRREGLRLAKEAGRDDLTIIYQVETLIFGRAVERTLKPERYIVGLENPAQFPTHLKQILTSFNCPILPMRYESAELAKISINICLISSVTTANVISELCEKIGADWGEIAPALRLDKRIGEYAYISPGLGIAGGNLERDLVTLREGLTAEGGSLGVVKAWEEDLNYRADWAFRKLMREAQKLSKPCIGVLGLAYKQDTNSIKNSPSIRLISKLSKIDIQAYDPAAEVDCAELNILRMNSALAACKGCDVAVIMTPWSEFRTLDPAALGAVMRGKCVIDPFRVLSAEAVRSAGLSYTTLGMRAE